jgi:hypothetical protein
MTTLVSLATKDFFSLMIRPRDCGNSRYMHYIGYDEVYSAKRRRSNDPRTLEEV